MTAHPAQPIDPPTLPGVDPTRTVQLPAELIPPDPGEAARVTTELGESGLPLVRPDREDTDPHPTLRYRTTIVIESDSMFGFHVAIARLVGTLEEHHRGDIARGHLNGPPLHVHVGPHVVLYSEEQPRWTTTEGYSTELLAWNDRRRRRAAGETR